MVKGLRFVIYGIYKNNVLRKFWVNMYILIGFFVFFIFIDVIIIVKYINLFLCYFFYS